MIMKRFFHKLPKPSDAESESHSPSLKSSSLSGPTRKKQKPLTKLSDKYSTEWLFIKVL